MAADPGSGGGVGGLFEFQEEQRGSLLDARRIGECIIDSAKLRARNRSFDQHSANKCSGCRERFGAGGELQ